jgi:hypothetical protein
MMTEADWLACDDPKEMLYIWGTVQNRRKRRLFAVACCWRISHLLTEAGENAVIAAEEFADGKISEHKLHDAWCGVGYPKDQKRRFASATARAASVSPRHDLSAHCAASAENAVAKKKAERLAQCELLREIFGNLFREVEVNPAWFTSTAVGLARGIYDDHAFDHMPILADALQEAGCENEHVLNHCRDPKQVHVRGCWVVDLVLQKGSDLVF